MIPVYNLKVIIMRKHQEVYGSKAQMILTF